MSYQPQKHTKTQNQSDSASDDYYDHDEARSHSHDGDTASDGAASPKGMGSSAKLSVQDARVRGNSSSSFDEVRSKEGNQEQNGSKKKAGPGKPSGTPQWTNESVDAKFFEENVGESQSDAPKNAGDKLDFIFGDDDVDFNFVADFSKLLSVVRFLLHTVRKQSKILKELEATVDNHSIHVDKLMSISLLGTVTQADLNRVMVLPNGRTIRDTVLTHNEDLTRTMETVADHSGRVAYLEEQVPLKAERETTVNILHFENLSKDYFQSKELLLDISSEMVEIRTLAATPQAKDDFCRQKVEEIQDAMSKIDDSVSNKLDKREYTYFLDGMMRKQRESDASSEKNENGPNGKATTKENETAVDPSVNPLLYGLMHKSPADAGFTSAIKNLTDAFLRTFNFNRNSHAHSGSESNAVGRGITPLGGRPFERLGVSEYGAVMKEMDKINFLINLKPYKHEVEDIVSSLSISKPHLELRLSNFFKQIRKVFKTDLMQLLQKFTGDPKQVRDMELKMASMEHMQEHHARSTMSTHHLSTHLGVDSPPNIMGPTPRSIASDIKSQNFGSQFTGSPLGPIGHAKGKLNDSKSPSRNQNASQSYSATQIGTSPLHSTNPQAKQRGGQSRTLKPLVKPVQEHPESVDPLLQSVPTSKSFAGSPQIHGSTSTNNLGDAPTPQLGDTKQSQFAMSLTADDAIPPGVMQDALSPSEHV